MSDIVNIPGLSRGDGNEQAAAPDDAAEAAYAGIRQTLVGARQRAAAAVNNEMVTAYWDVGRRIVEAQGERAEYGKRLLHYLAQRLTAEFGSGYGVTNLRNMRRFYLAFPTQQTLSAELSWSHYNELTKVPDEQQRDFYTREAAASGWTVRQLRRQISTNFHGRLLASSNEHQADVAREVFEEEPRTTADDLLKDPYVLEFVDVAEPSRFQERDLEQGLIDKLQDFLLELGRGFSFVGRQKRVTADGEHFYVDLVFYNFILKCFVLIDLKIGKLSHEDIGQMDFYRRVIDDKVRPKGDNPSIGLILCSEKNEAVAKYSILSDDVGLYAAKYATYLPTEEELRFELQRERELIERRLDDEAGDA